MAITRLTQRKVKAICYYVSSWFVATIGYAVLAQYASTGEFNKQTTLFALQLAIFMGLSHGIYDVLVLQDEMDHRPAYAALLMKSAFYLSCIFANITICVLLWYSDHTALITEDTIGHLIEAFKTPRFQILALYLFLMGHLITFVRSVHKKFGTRVFVNTLLGKYQDPVEEDLVFMFIDLRRSTAIAEELGHVTYSNFMKDYYRLLSNCTEENHGEIYQIAGDGAFLTWKTSACKNIAHPINCFYDFSICLEKTKHRFMKKYGIAPSFKVGAHCGKVIATEVGNFGSEMAYHGDVLNATARIQSLCAKLGQEFLISEELFEILPKPFEHGYLCKKEGFFELRGRKKEILIFSLQKPLTNPN
ncbi:MAG: adenylate/guanylate cyclase domain-containing protein [Fibrobacter sp.]|nr:adenylate/guanylate cyclase domain-containing protein [Fibrobacter sp.]